MLVNFKVVLAARRRHAVDVALEVGIDPTFLSLIVNERRKADAGLRARLAAVLNVDEDWLFSTCAQIPAPKLGAATRSASVPTSVREDR